jgi:RimJ/RimL family protein N-acetyltransferase
VISESILEGERVRLRPVEESDLPHFVRWLPDPELNRWLEHMENPPTLEEEYEWWHEKRSDPDCVLWAIEGAEGRLVGTIELRLTLRAERAELGVAIHDRTQWGKGLGTEAVRLVVDYAFEELNLNRVELTTDEENARAIRCYEKVGFEREGLLRQHRLLDGRFGNTVVMGILRGRWQPLDRGWDS